MLLFGPPGTGKSSMVKVAAREYGYSLVEFNSSDKRTKIDLKVIERASLTQGIGKKKLLLLDEIDGFTPSGIISLIKILEGTNCPIVLTANNKNKLNSLKGKCYFIGCPKITNDNIRGIILGVAKYRKIVIHEKILLDIINKSKGDARHALTELEKIQGMDPRKAIQLLSEKDEDVSINYFTEMLFTSEIEDIEHAGKKIKFADVEYVINIFLENLPDVTKDINLIDSYYKIISKMDIMLNTIKRKQRYKLLRNIYLYFSHVIPLVRDSKNLKVVVLSDPSYLVYTYEKRRKIKIAKKLGKIYNCSAKNILTNFIIYKKLLRNKENLIYAIVNAKIDKQDVDYLFGKKESEQYSPYFPAEVKVLRSVKLTNIDEDETRKRKKSKKKIAKDLSSKGNLSDWM